MPLTEDQKREGIMASLAIPEEKRGPRALAEKLGTAAACASLFCCIWFWMAMVLFLLFPKIVLLPNVTGFQVFKIMAVTLALAVIAAILRSRLWRFALPISAATFLLVWYVMVT